MFIARNWLTGLIRSMGADETFALDTDDREVVVRTLLRLSGRVGSRMRTAGVAGRTVTLRIRMADFTTLTRSRTLAEPTDVTVTASDAPDDVSIDSVRASLGSQS